MRKKKVFISFDYENDKDIKGCLKDQLTSDVINIGVVDTSIDDPVIDERWQKEAKRRISSSNCVIFLCGEKTNKAKGVEAEMTITRELNKPYFLLRGRKKKKVTVPKNALKIDEINKWTRDNLIELLK